MAYKKQVDDIKGQLKRFRHLVHYTVRLLPIVVIAGAMAWFFVLRSPGEQAKTSGTGGTTPPATTSTKAPDKQPESKVADKSAAAASSTAETDGAKDETGKLPETGPTDTLAIFAVAATAGTLFWEWRLRRIKHSS